MVANCTLPDVALAGIVSDGGNHKRTISGKQCNNRWRIGRKPQREAQFPEIPGVSTTGVQDSDKGLITGAIVRDMPRWCCRTQSRGNDGALRGGNGRGDAVNVADRRIRRDSYSSRNSSRETERCWRGKRSAGAGAILERVTVQVVLALEARLETAH